MEIIPIEYVLRHMMIHENRPRGYKTLIFMLNSNEHEISTAHKNKNTDK